MFNAVIGESDPVCIFDYSQAHRPYLREWSNTGTFRCPACLSILSVKLGTERRWHFAHKGESPDDCPLKLTDHSTIETIAVLYSWLKGIASVEELAVEFFPPETMEPILMDFKFRIEEKKYLYKVIGKRTPLHTFYKNEQLRKNYILNYIFTEQTLNPKGDEFLLNSTQRHNFHFAEQSSKAVGYIFDQPIYEAFMLVVDCRRGCFHKLKRCNWAGSERAKHAELLHSISFNEATISTINGDVVYRENP